MRRRRFLMGLAVLAVPLHGGAHAQQYIAYDEVPPHDGFDRSLMSLSLQIQHRRIARGWSLGIDYFRGHNHYNVEFVRNVAYWGISLSWYPVSAGFL